MLGIKKLSEPKNILILGVVYSLFITVLLLMPSTGVPKFNLPYLDKVVHACVFLLLAFIWLLVFFSRKLINTKNISLLLLTLLVYGIIVEVLQGAFLVSRQADVWDVMANTLGILGGLLLFYKTKNKLD